MYLNKIPFCRDNDFDNCILQNLWRIPNIVLHWQGGWVDCAPKSKQAPSQRTPKDRHNTIFKQSLELFSFLVWQLKLIVRKKRSFHLYIHTLFHIQSFNFSSIHCSKRVTNFTVFTWTSCLFFCLSKVNECLFIKNNRLNCSF